VAIQPVKRWLRLLEILTSCKKIFVDNQSKDACKNHNGMDHDPDFHLCCFYNNVLNNSIGAIAMAY
jgi:hypothetical protein